MAVENSLQLEDTPRVVGSFPGGSIGKTSPRDNTLPSSPTEGITPLHDLKPQAVPSSENDTSEQHLPIAIGYLDEKSEVASHDQKHDTYEEETSSNDDDQMSEDNKKCSSEIVEEKAEEIAEKIVKYGHYLQMMGKQIVQWEKEIQKKELKQNGGGESTGTEDKRFPAIPKVGRVAWTEFKNRIAADKRYPAIEVLVGEARFYWEYHSDKRQKHERTTSEDDLQEEANEEIVPPTSPTSIPYREVPERIRINSIPIVLALADIASERWYNLPTIMLRPFKFLKYFEKEIRQDLAKLEVKWAAVEKTEENGPKSQLSESNGERSGPIPSEDVKQPRVLINPGDHEPDKLRETKKSSEQSKINNTSVNDPQETEVSSESRNLKSPKEIYSNKKGKVETTAEELMDGVEALRDMRCLVQFIDTYLKPQWQCFDTVNYHNIQFADLWHIFNPGDDVIAPLQPGQEQTPGSELLGSRNGNHRSQLVWRVLNTTGGRSFLSPPDKERDYSTTTTAKYKQSYFMLWCYYIDYDGEKFGPVIKQFKIKPYQGEKEIRSLEVYPLKYANNASELLSQLKTRGLKFCEFKFPQHRYYAGLSLAHQPTGDSIWNSEEDMMIHPEHIASQVVVDIGAALQENPHWTPRFHVAGQLPIDLREIQEDYPTKVWKDNQLKTLQYEVEDVIYDDYRIDTKLTSDFGEREPSFQKEDGWEETSSAAAQLGDKDLILLPARVFAYSFRNRKYVPVKINNLRPIKPRKEGFNNLKLPVGYKITVQAMVKSHFSNKLANQASPEDDYDFDIVRGKGTGLIVLLHGAPGVGKTSTAECVAESHGKPLYPITCGDLGLVADEVEAKLARIFHLAEQWDCVLLLDEADIFLAERTRTDIKRNSLVSVFLRVLEYYTGILFLTTNRVGAFDPAFKSRIHMHLYYPPLREKQTLSIWKMNLERTLERKKTLIVNEKEIMDYALSHFHKTSPLKANWNGRQIRNAFQTATALAEYDSAVGSPPRLSQKYFDIVAKASLDFDQYMETTHDANDADRAFQNMDRNDKFKSPTDSRHHDPSRQLDPRFPPPPQYPPGPSSLGSYSPQWQPDPSAATRSPQRYAPPTMATMQPGRAYGPSVHLGAEAAYVNAPLAAASAMPAVHPQSVNEAVLYREEAGGAHPGGGWQRPQASYNEPGLVGGGGGGISEDEGYE